MAKIGDTFFGISAGKVFKIVDEYDQLDYKKYHMYQIVTVNTKFGIRTQHLKQIIESGEWISITDPKQLLILELKYGK